MAPTILKITPSVNPAIANGRRRMKNKIKRMSKTSASGQHNTKSMHIRISAMKNFIIGLLFTC